MLSELARVTAVLLTRPNERLSPATLLFLVRRYPEAPSAALHAALERALGDGLAAFEDENDARVRWRWLGAFADASVMVADDALNAFVSAQLPDAVDALERVVRRDYEPGEGAAGRGGVDDLLLALALLVAFDLTARLPYAMLAEELLQTSRRFWSAPSGPLADDVVAACRAAQLCFRLASLHRDPDYVARAVIAPGVRYDDIGTVLLTALHERVAARHDATAEYGLAMLDRLALQAHPN